MDIFYCETEFQANDRNIVLEVAEQRCTRTQKHTTRQFFVRKGIVTL